MSMKVRNASIGMSSGDNIDLIPINYNVNMNILIVEDNYYNQNTVKRLLNMLGYYNLTICDGGKEAIKLIKNNKGDKLEMKNKKIMKKSFYDLILMDIVMPEMDGITASKKITEMFNSRSLRPKIIAVTANVMNGDRERCIDDGEMDAYISKPINKEALCDLLAQI